MLTVVIVVVVLLFGYLVSLRIHPFRPCRMCRGTGRHRGSFYTRTHRPCRACGGNGRAERLGVRVLGVGPKK